MWSFPSHLMLPGKPWRSLCKPERLSSSVSGRLKAHFILNIWVTTQIFAGLSNFSSPKIKRLLESATIKPICNQIECHPYYPQKGLVKLCQDENIHITAFGPLGCVPIPALVGRSGPGPLMDETV